MTTFLMVTMTFPVMRLCGANFIVEWSAEGLITDPLIEAVMVGSLGAQGFAFTSRGKPMIKETP